MCVCIYWLLSVFVYLSDFSCVALLTIFRHWIRLPRSIIKEKPNQTKPHNKRFFLKMLSGWIDGWVLLLRKWKWKAEKVQGSHGRNDVCENIEGWDVRFLDVIWYCVELPVWWWEKSFLLFVYAWNEIILTLEQMSKWFCIQKNPEVDVCIIILEHSNSDSNPNP